MCRHGDIRRVADNFVFNSPFLIYGVLLREIQRPSHDPDAGEFPTIDKLTAELLEMCPVVSIEALADLRTHVCQDKGRVHCFLRPFRVGRRYLVASVVTGAKVVGKFGTEGSGQRSIFMEEGKLAVAIVEGEGGGGDVLGDPVRIASLAVERGQVRRRGG